MTRIRILLVVGLMAVSSLAIAQDSMKKGDKDWTDLEKQLADINDQWVCAHKYHKDHAQDCVDFKNKIWLFVRHVDGEVSREILSNRSEEHTSELQSH